MRQNNSTASRHQAPKQAAVELVGTVMTDVTADNLDTLSPLDARHKRGTMQTLHSQSTPPSQS